jgi:hypothetical protein
MPELSELLSRLCNREHDDPAGNVCKDAAEAIRGLIEERDEARREVCQKHRHGYFTDEDYAEVRGWTCFERKADSDA